MEPRFSTDRRRGDRRQGDRRSDAKAQGGSRKDQRRQGSRRQVERREFFRIVYPPTLVPTTLNGEFRVVNISRQGIVLRWEGRHGDCPANLTLGSVIHLQVEFHDGETLDLEVKVTRCQSERCSHRSVFAGTIEPALAAARISKEEAYLLRTVPDFCRVEWDSGSPPVYD
jgi:hypothetical protein